MIVFVLVFVVVVGNRKDTAWPLTKLVQNQLMGRW